MSSLGLLFRRRRINLPPVVREIRERRLFSESASELEDQVNFKSDVHGREAAASHLSHPGLAVALGPECLRWSCWPRGW